MCKTRSAERNVQKRVLRKCKVVVVVVVVFANREEKSLCHVATVAKFLDQTTNQKRHLTK